MKNYLIFFIIISFIFFLLSFFLSCERVAPLPEKWGVVEQNELADPNIIPLEFGQLVSVTSPIAGIAHLWFQDENFTIRIVQINYGKAKIAKDVHILKRQ